MDVSFLRFFSFFKPEIYSFIYVTAPVTTRNMYKILNGYAYGIIRDVVKKKKIATTTTTSSSPLYL